MQIIDLIMKLDGIEFLQIDCKKIKINITDLIFQAKNLDKDVILECKEVLEKKETDGTIDFMKVLDK
ncbi:hypothetical protein JCM1393_21220 [Clostridium carnis]